MGTPRASSASALRDEDGADGHRSSHRRGQVAPCRLAALGLVNSLGMNPDDVWAGLIEGRTTSLSRRDDLVAGRSLLVGAVRGDLPEIPRELSRFSSRNNRMMWAALRQIEEPVRTAVREFGASRVGVVVGTSTSGVSDAEDAIRHQARQGGLPPSFDYAQLEFGGIAAFTASVLGIEGLAYTLSTACSSGARALASARSLISLGLCDAVVAGAADTLCGLTAGGFTALQAVSEGVTNPCSRNRSGLTLGEGAAAFLVLPSPGGIQLLGAGDSSEAHHMSAPDPSGEGAETAMRAALADARLDPGDIAYLNLHGTGTSLNDQMECLAVERVLGTACPVSSTKPMVGHLLGAAGIIEAAFCWLVLDRAGRESLAIPPHIWDGDRDPVLPNVHLVKPGDSVVLDGPARVMTNSFGFGGNNCTLILGDAG